MNSKFKQYLAVIQKEWMDPKIVAASYAAYIDSKIQVASDIRNSIYQSVSFMEELPSKGQEIQDIMNGNYTDEIKTKISEAIGYNFNDLMNICVPTTNGDLVQLKTIMSSYANAVYSGKDTVTCESLNNQPVAMSDILESINTGVDLNFAISSALDGYANDKTPADYLSELSANLGDRFQTVSSYASKAFNVLRDNNLNVIDKIQTLVNPITEFDDNSVSGNFIRADVDTSMYTGVSPAVFWFDATMNTVEAVANIYIQSLKLSWKITVAIFKVVTSLFVGIWNKFLRGLFVTDDILVNDNSNCDYLNIPRSQFRVDIDYGETASAFGYSGVPDILVKKFGYTSVTVQDIWTAIFNNGYAVDIPLKFGLIRLIKDGDTLVRQIYLTPNTPIAVNDLIWLTTDNRGETPTFNCNGKSIEDQFNALFVNSQTEDVNVTKDDKFYWRAFQVAIARMDFFLGLISTSFILNDAAYVDQTCSSLKPGPDGFGLAVLFGSRWYLYAGGNQNNLGYISPSSNYNMNGINTADDVSMTRLDYVPNQNPSNANFLTLIALGTTKVCDSTDASLLAGIPTFSCWSLLAYIYATTRYGMSQLAAQGGSIKSVTFFPYNKSNKNDFVFKYTLASDEYNRQAFNHQLKITATAVIVVAATFVIFKGVKRLKANALTDLQRAQSQMWDNINDPSLSPDQLKILQENLYQANNKYNRIFGVSSSLGGINLTSSNSDVQSIIKLLK